MGWVIISVLQPKGKVYFHHDIGIYFAFHDRYHFVLQTTGSRVFQSGQIFTYKPGEVWWFNNKVTHGVSNDSDKERIHVIFDLKPNSYIGRVRVFLLWLYWGLRPGRFKKYYFGDINESRVHKY